MDPRKFAPGGQVALVSFADARTRDVLAHAIESLGVRLQCVDAAAWLDSPHAARDVVLLLDDGAYPRERLLAILRDADAPRVFGAFSGAAAASDAELFGACVDFLGWPCHPAELSLRIGRLLQGQAGAPQVVEADVLDECMRQQMLGRSKAVLAALAVLKKFARCEAPVLIEGETGTGKELAARAIHYVGARRDHPFIAVNCGAIPDDLLENELFGHERGAYTDARERRAGLVEQAERGTLFFDEVDALSDKGQVTLLRFLQEQEYRPLGGRDLRRSDARILAATNMDLAGLAARGRFRKDLVFRLRVLTVTLPPLRERDGDVALLAEHFLRLYGARYRQGARTLHRETLEWMGAYGWPGNVRELENLLHRHYLLAEGPVIRIAQGGESGPAPPEGKARDEVHFRDAKARAVARFEREFLRALLVDAGGNISLAARRAGKDRSAFRRLLHKHGLHAEHGGPGG